MAATDFRRFLDTHLSRVEPLSREINLAYWRASISGEKRDFDRFAELQIELQRLYSDRSDFARVRDWRGSDGITDPLDNRQVEILYHAYLRNQIDPVLNERITRLGTRIENQFSVHRAILDGKAITSNDVLQILKESNDSTLRRKAWEAGKAVGRLVETDLRALVNLRNEGARSLGFRDYYAMSLELGEQRETEVVALFDELEELTRASFEQMKEDLHARLAKRFGIAVDDIRPWHYEDPFAQEAPRVFRVDLDSYYEDQDIIGLVRRFYEGVGLPVDDILARSDLYEKPGKDQHAYCTDIDRKGDIRILANIKNDETWAGTMLHELGHAVHDKFIDRSLPYLLRQEAHIFTTEAIAMLFGRLSKNATWIQRMIGISHEEKAEIESELAQNQRLAQLVFSRWSQVMMRFERGLYADPDQDLNELWWTLVQRYQGIAPPEQGDSHHWATKTHIVSVPVYYHNYLLGELLASQLGHYILHDVTSRGGDGGFVGDAAVGDYLREHVFEPGTSRRWDAMIELATGEPLTPRYFVDQFVRKDG